MGEQHGTTNKRCETVPKVEMNVILDTQRWNELPHMTPVLPPTSRKTWSRCDPPPLSSCILRHSAVEDLRFLAKLSHQGVPKSVAIMLATVLEHFTNDIN